MNDPRAKLNARQLAFAREYAIDPQHRIEASAVAAGYSPKTARTTGSRLMKNDAVQAVIAEYLDAAAENAGVTIERVIAELGKIAFADVRAAVTWGPGWVEIRASDELPDDMAAAIASVKQRRTTSGDEVHDTIELKLVDKMSALGKLLDYLKPAEGGDGSGVQVFVAVGERPAAIAESNGSANGHGVRVASRLPPPEE